RRSCRRRARRRAATCAAFRCGRPRGRAAASAGRTGRGGRSARGCGGRARRGDPWKFRGRHRLWRVARRTERIGLGTGILSMWGRTPATMALAAAGLQRCSGGRFRLGIGAGSPPLAEGFHGMPWDRPMAQLRRTVTAVRALLDGERLPEPVAGARPLRLGVPPETRVPLAVAALAPASIRLAGELADAW